MLEQVADWPAPTKAAGVTDPTATLETTGPAADHRFAWASLTKLLTALAVHVAVEEGTVALDDPAGPPGSTLRHLLAHASGMGPDDPAPVAAPGTRRIYSNAGYEAAAAHVETASGGIPFATYLDEAVFQPLGIAGTTTLDGSPASGATGTVADLLALGRELLRPTLIAPATHRAMTDVAFPGLAGVLPGFGRQDPNDWGLGPERRDAKQPHWTGTRNSDATFGHFGRAGGFLWVDPVADRALGALTDLDFGPWAAEAWPRLSDAVLTQLDS